MRSQFDYLYYPDVMRAARLTGNTYEITAGSYAFRMTPQNGGFLVHPWGKNVGQFASIPANAGIARRIWNAIKDNAN